ncbi:hypothetical protein FF100_01135 [Methylobacterium terricola]|uniref:Anti-sigma factor NepR domain-containing protein n=1 Tax=Methylobacterium terricola TaxID=2583531 RepID=A0A5C4LNT0_9HYPH|nr:hypothetical protein [Methylobacterium terricola]TNC15900.1 hypothetical protein FF100_01135 [Methylobacterium terricola]
MIASDSHTPRSGASQPGEPPEGGPTLDAASRERLGRYLQALYEPVLDEGLDPRLAELLTQLDRDRAEQEGDSPPGRPDH